MSTFYTRKGDDGTTGLLGEGRVPKFDLRMDALGALDEASAALGLARSLMKSEGMINLVVQLQRELYLLMAEVASTPENAHRFRKIDEARVAWLEAQTEEVGKNVNLPGQFIVPGDSPSGAALSLARAIVRRAERRIAELASAGQFNNPQGVAFINRLSSLCYVLELHENQAGGNLNPTLAKGSGY